MQTGSMNMKSAKYETLESVLKLSKYPNKDTRKGDNRMKENRGLSSHIWWRNDDNF